jgi:Cu-processing system ATP-binding protein
MSQTDALAIDGVDKLRGKVRVLSGVSLRLAPGEKVALLGHNGAGKTTLMKIVLGLTAASSGAVRVDGAAPGSASARRATAYLPEAIAFHKALTGREQLTLFARLTGTGRSHTTSLLERVGLGQAADQRIGTYSKGMRQRLGLAQVLLGRPAVVLLDEPTSGLDPVSRADLYTIIDELASQGAAVLVASHALTEVEARTDRVAIMREGRIVADDTLARLSERAGLTTKIRVRTTADAADQVAANLGGRRINGAAVELVCTQNGKMVQLRRIAALGDAVTDVEMTSPGLEDLYRHYSQEPPQ